jgi:hypothetical protein
VKTGRGRALFPGEGWDRKRHEDVMQDAWVPFVELWTSGRQCPRRGADHRATHRLCLLNRNRPAILSSPTTWRGDLTEIARGSVEAETETLGIELIAEADAARLEAAIWKLLWAMQELRQQRASNSRDCKANRIARTETKNSRDGGGRGRFKMKTHRK